MVQIHQVRETAFSVNLAAQEEQEDHLTKEIGAYIEAFFDKAACPSVESQSELKEAYIELDSQIKEAVEESISEILKEAILDIEEEKVDSLLKEILAQPFKKIVDKTKPAEEQEIQVLGAALLRANQKLAGFS